MSREVEIATNQRYAIVAKTGAGKTRFAMVLASLLVPEGNKEGWETWWIDTKGDRDDWNELAQFGFVDQAERKHRFLPGVTRKPEKSNRKLFRVDPHKGPIWEQAQELFNNAYNHQGVLVVVDEYTQVIKNQINPGEGLMNIFTRGRGLDVGIIGMTQEPVYVPRQLLSQASHQFLLSVTYPRDIYYLKQMYSEYEPPVWRGDRYGFYHIAVDYDGLAAYYHHQRHWFDNYFGKNSERKVA